MKTSLVGRLGAAALVLFLTPWVSAADTPKAEPPAKLDDLVDLLFQPAALEQASLSPDGTHLAFICEVNDHKVAGIYDLVHATQKLAGLDNSRSVSWIRWVGNDRLLLGLGSLYSADLELKDVRELPLPDRNIRWGLLAWRPQAPNEALLTAFARSELYSDLYQLSYPSRRIKLLENNPGKVLGWTLDEAGTVRLGGILGPHETTSYLYRAKAGDPWVPEPLPNSASPICFNPDGQSVLLTYRDSHSRNVVQYYDLTKHQLVGTPLLSDPFCDVDPQLMRDHQTGAPIALLYESEKPQYFWLNEQYRKVHALLERSFPNTVIQILGMMPGNRLLFGAYSDTVPAAFYVLDLSHPSIGKLLDSHPATSGIAWAPMKPITFPARDGADLHGYLTLPRHRAPNQPLAFVVLSHGGPRARDTWEFNPEVQFFAALGYGVLQVNYRGSSGYGDDYLLKTDLAVCEKSVDDVVDGINWAVKYGYADPKKIVVYGASYGGYISLAIATRYPDLPAATVGFAGVYDWIKQYSFDDTESYERMQFLHKNMDYYVDPKANADKFRAFSPVNFADRVRSPVLLLHGGADQVVDITQTNLMAAALQAAGKSVEVVKDAQVVHGFPRAKERRTFYTKMGAFLLKYAPPGN